VRLLLDVDVLLDVLADRPDFVKASGRVLSLVEQGRIEGWVAAHTVTTLYYLLSRELGAKKARKVVADLLSILEVVPVDADRLGEALASPMKDFEDAVQAACARAVDVRFLVTRNLKDFRRADVPVASPTELLAAIAATDT